MKLSAHWLILCAVALLKPALAQPETKPLKVEPDTPDFTIGTSTVPKGHLQTETRITAERRAEMHEYGIGETLLRYGITERAEIRIGAPSYLFSRENGRMTGFDDATLETKIRFFEGSKSKYGLLIDSVLPTGSRRVAEHRYQPSVTLTSQFTLSEKLELLANLGARRASAEGLHFTKNIGAASLRYDVTPKTKIYSEVYGFSRLEAAGKSQKFIGLGVIQLVNDRTALDVRLGGGLGNDIGGPDYFYEFGISHLF